MRSSDRLLAPPDTESALARLAERGDFPSDLYEINIIANVADIYGNRFDLEKHHRNYCPLAEQRAALRTAPKAARASDDFLVPEVISH